jgi:hypothetical protein
MTYSAVLVARNDAPLIGERAASRGRIATEGGDGDAGVKRHYMSQSLLFTANVSRFARGNRMSASSPQSTARLATTMRRSSPIAPPREGAAQRKVAMSTPV